MSYNKRMRRKPNPVGVRLDPKHDERTRAKIQTSQLLNRLYKHANGEVEMTPSQIKAADILLKKTLPDLSAMQVYYKDDTAHNILKNGAKIETLADAEQAYMELIKGNIVVLDDDDMRL